MKFSSFLVIDERCYYFCMRFLRSNIFVVFIMVSRIAYSIVRKQMKLSVWLESNSEFLKAALLWDCQWHGAAQPLKIFCQLQFDVWFWWPTWMKSGHGLNSVGKKTDMRWKCSLCNSLSVTNHVFSKLISTSVIVIF